MPQDAQRPASGSRADVPIPPTWPGGSRSRALAAMTVVVDDRGYAETRVSDLLVRARMSRRTFYRHFDNIEECFFAAYEAVRDDALNVLDTAFMEGAYPEERLSQCLDALLAHLAAWPTHAMLLTVHVAGAGPMALAQHERTMNQLERRLIACLCADDREVQEERQLVAQAIIGAIQRLLQLGLLRGPPQALTRLAPTLTAVALRMAA